MAKYFSIPNLVTREIRAASDDPVQLNKEATQACSVASTTKEERREWLANPATNTHVISLFEGLNPELRVSEKEGNPVAVVHGFIVDYDAPSPGNFEDQAKHAKDFYRDNPSLAPQWVVRSPSGNYRLVWEFAEPCSLRGCPEKFDVALIAEFRKTCRLGSVLAGLDEAALTKPSTYYDARGDWKRVNINPLPAAEVDGMFFSAARKASKSLANGTLSEIPMEAVLEKINELYPGRWPVDIPFVDGCRGPAVWDDTATNPTTTIYTTRGAFRFSSTKGFHSYTELLGKEFVRQWEDNRMGQVTKNFYYLAGTSGRAVYYTKVAGMWVSQGLNDVHRRMVGVWNLNRKAASATDISDVDKAVMHVQDFRRVDAALPVVYNKNEVVQINGKHFLNLSRVRVMDPAPEAIDIGKRAVDSLRPFARNPYRWGDGFPWIAEWLGSMFDDPHRQLVYLLAWMKFNYEAGLNGEPNKTQVLFLVGNTDRGKTLFNGPDFMGAIKGGVAEATDYILGQTSFNRDLAEVGHWRIDDAKAAGNWNQIQKFTEGVKAYAANPTINYQPKYVDAQAVPHNGSLCVTLNEDSESLRMIPDLVRSIVDKVIILRLSEEKPFNFPERGVITKTLKSQIPYFLRWLIHWSPPPSILHPRFGIKSFVHEKVRVASLGAGDNADILDLLELLWRYDDEFIEIQKTDSKWEGTAADFFSVVVNNPTIAQAAKGQTPRILGRKLSSLACIEGSGVSKREGSARSTIYTIVHPDSPKARIGKNRGVPRTVIAQKTRRKNRLAAKHAAAGVDTRTQKP